MSDELNEVTDALQSVAYTLDTIRRRLDQLSTERGVPIKNTVARVNKATEYVVGAREYWKHDVLQGNAKLTKSEMRAAEAFELS